MRTLSNTTCKVFAGHPLFGDGYCKRDDFPVDCDHHGVLANLLKVEGGHPH